MLFHIWTNGDSSVGLAGEGATLDTDVDCYDGEDRTEYIAAIKDALGEAFSSIWSDGRVHVATDQELLDCDCLDASEPNQRSTPDHHSVKV